MDINAVINKLNPYLRHAAYDVMPLNWMLYERIIFDYEILYIKNGFAKIKNGKKTYDAKPGDIFFFSPNKIHSITSFGKANFIQPHVHFDFFHDELSSKVYIPFNTKKNENKSLIRKNIISPEFYIKDYFEVPDHFIAENLILEIVRLHKSMQLSDSVQKKAKLLELIAFLIEKSSPQEKLSEVPYDNFFMHINSKIAQYSASELDLAAFANNAGYSKNHLSALYKEHFGITIKHYHEQLRLARAIEYLTQEDISITQIASSLSFDTIHDFSRFFKRLTGTSPSDYRKKILSENR